ncbi:hypothetical protein BGX23_006068 [Mortierella sp. AD031]|nr:hypothetical protein BGX23_006068 [Mortierella sp. AD031]
MDVDVEDEVGLNSIASTITNLRQHTKPGDASTVGAWANGAAPSRRTEEDDPDSVVVLDTNILISHLNFFQSLIKSYGAPPDKTKSNHAQTNVIFVIPWVVIHELDGLKTGGRGGTGSDVDVAGKARSAIEYLRSELSKSSSSLIRGQKMSEMVAKVEANDDKILDCCQYFRVLYPNQAKTKVFIFTNDKNLSVKALVHEFQVITRFKVNIDLLAVRNVISGTIANCQDKTSFAQDSDEESMMLDDDDSVWKHNSDTGKDSAGKSSRRGSSYRVEHNDRELQRIKAGSQAVQLPNGMDPKLFQLTNHVLKTLRRFLEATIPDHLQARYGSTWKEHTNFDRSRVKEEDLRWESKRLTQPFRLLEDQWSYVFSDLYSRPSQAKKARESLDQLQAFTKTWSRVEVFGLGKVYKKNVAVLLDDVDNILSAIATMPASVTAASLPNSASFYDASNRIHLMKSWRTECDRLHD